MPHSLLQQNRNSRCAGKIFPTQGGRQQENAHEKPKLGEVSAKFPPYLIGVVNPGFAVFLHLERPVSRQFIQKLLYHCWVSDLDVRQARDDGRRAWRISALVQGEKQRGTCKERVKTSIISVHFCMVL